MTAEELKSWVHRKPFRPVVIRMANGASYPIVQSHSVAVMPKEVFVYFGRRDEHKFIRLDEIVGVEDMPNEAMATQVGSEGAVSKQAVEVWLNRMPFEAFRVNTVDGRHFDVTNPRMVIVTDARIFMVLDEDRWADVALGEVVSLEARGD